MNSNRTQEKKAGTYKLALFLLTFSCKGMEVPYGVTAFLNFAINILFTNKTSSASGFLALINNIIFFSAKLLGPDSVLQS